MGTSSRRTPRAPGTRGAHHDPKFQNPSRFICWPPTTGAETLCAMVFFATNDDIVHGDDIPVVQRVAEVLRYHELMGEPASCECVGRADVRHDPPYNLALSERRADAVAKEIRKAIPKKLHSKVTFRGTGETGSQLASSMWAEDRRVDVKLRVRGLATVRASVGVEADENSNIEMIFMKSIEKLELNNLGKVMTWLRSELHTLWDMSVKETDRKRFEAPSVAKARHAGMTFDQYVRLARSRVTACVRLSYGFDVAKDLHRLSGQILVAATMRPMFPKETVEAARFLDINGTSYLSSPKENPLQVWRRLPAGQTAPSGATTKTTRGAPDGLLAKPQDLYDKLRARFPSITARVKSAM